MSFRYDVRLSITMYLFIIYRCIHEHRTKCMYFMLNTNLFLVPYYKSNYPINGTRVYLAIYYHIPTLLRESKMEFDMQTYNTMILSRFQIACSVGTISTVDPVYTIMCRLVSFAGRLKYRIARVVNVQYQLLNTCTVFSRVWSFFSAPIYPKVGWLSRTVKDRWFVLNVFMYRRKIYVKALCSQNRVWPTQIKT